MLPVITSLFLIVVVAAAGLEKQGKVEEQCELGHMGLCLIGF